ncbi:MAG: FAD:protein FMN transferase, partial [Gaiellaceae bacterium]
MSSAALSSEFAALGTSAVIRVTEPSALEPARLLLEEELAAIDRACSRFRPDSELARVNRARGDAVSIGPLFTAALRVALRAAELTGGAVDPTVGRALRLAGYDRDFSFVLADGRGLTHGRIAVPGWRAVDLDAARGTVRLPAGVELDLGASAKAFAADRAAERIRASLAAGVLVSLGGDLAVAGPLPPGGWSVGLADDHADRARVAETVAITTGGVATSSTQVRRWRRGDRELHHLIDPRTGLPAISPWRTVTVAAASCVDANTASTAALIRGEQAAGWLDALALPARLVRRDGRVLRVGGWP